MTISYPLIGPLQEENWALIPSDPALFNDMIKQYDAKDVEVEDLIALDLEYLKQEKTVHGIIFISKFNEELESARTETEDPDAEDIVFTSQVVTNVCGSLALLAVLFNADIAHKGAIIDNFLEFTKGFSPVNRGLCIGNSAAMRNIHDAYGGHSVLLDKAYNKNSLTEEESASPSQSSAVEVKTESAFHYTSFIFKNGFLWEIDGLKPRPIKHSACTSDTWLNKAEEILKHRVQVVTQKYPDDELSFNMMAVVESTYTTKSIRNKLYQANLPKLEKLLTNRTKRKAALINNGRNAFIRDTDVNMPDYSRLLKIWDDMNDGNFEEAKGNIESLLKISKELKDDVTTYEENMKLMKEEAIRQKFDYFPFIEALFKISHKRKLIEVPEDEEPATKKQKGRSIKKLPKRLRK